MFLLADKTNYAELGILCTACSIIMCKIMRAHNSTIPNLIVGPNNWSRDGANNFISSRNHLL